MVFHTEYADGCPRPYFRGWLHGMGTLVLLPLVAYYWNCIPTPATPGMLGICCTFLLSSLVHLVPWKSAKVLNTLSKVDRSSILATCGLSFWGPQLLQESLCKPDLVVSLSTVAIPVLMGIVGVLCGMGPIVFVGCISSFASTFWFYGTQINHEEREFFNHAVACLLLYGVGLYFYASQLGGHKKYWGYHEWMHLLVTIGAVVNIRGILVMSDYTNEQCRPDLFFPNNIIMDIEIPALQPPSSTSSIVLSFSGLAS